MDFWVMSIATIFAISFVWALASLKKELSNPREIEEVKKELTRERVIFRA
jgi:hypothetical protein